MRPRTSPSGILVSIRRAALFDCAEVPPNAAPAVAAMATANSRTTRNMPHPNNRYLTRVAREDRNLWSYLAATRVLRFRIGHLVQRGTQTLSELDRIIV